MKWFFFNLIFLFSQVALLAQTRLIPHVTALNGGFDTEFQISNMSSGPVTIELIPYTNGGENLGEVAIAIPANSVLFQTKDELFGEGIEVSHIELNQAPSFVKVTTIYQFHSGQGSPVHLQENTLRGKAWRLFAGNWDLVFDGLALVNISEKETSITLRQFNAQGDLVQERTIVTDFPPNYKTLYTIGAPGMSEFQAIPNGYFEIDSTQDIAVVSLRGTPSNATDRYLWENSPILIQHVDTNEPGLSVEQRVSDFEFLVHMANKKYGPMQWKHNALGIDLLAIAKEIRRDIASSSSDLEFFDHVQTFISHFHDSHVGFSLPSNRTAFLGFGVDFYDGRLLVDFIPYEGAMNIGDELLTLDGVNAIDLIDSFKKFSPAGFDDLEKRLAATYLTYRPQATIPELASGSVQVEVLRTNGVRQSLTIPWRTNGLPYIPGSYEPALSKQNTRQQSILERLDWISPWSKEAFEREFNSSLFKYGHLEPSFELPESFQLLYGDQEDQELYAGTYQAGDNTLGYLRIPKMWIRDQSTTNDLIDLVAQFKEGTDGLIIDVMDNPGGSVYWSNLVAQQFHTETFSQILFEMRPLLADIHGMEQDLNSDDLSPAERTFLQNLYDHLKTAHEQGAHLSEPLSLDSKSPDVNMPPAKDGLGNHTGYDKPIIMLINELSVSGGDYFPATMQDSGRAKLLGMRTAGGGGHVVSYANAMPYSEGSFSMTESLMVRPKSHQYEGYPETAYIENVGVHPDITYDYQTEENLINGGAHFVEFFTQALIQEIVTAQTKQTSK